MRHDDAARLVQQALGRDMPCHVAGMAQSVAGRALVADRFQAGRDLTGGWDDPIRALELQVALRLDAIMTGSGG